MDGRVIAAFITAGVSLLGVIALWFNNRDLTRKALELQSAKSSGEKEATQRLLLENLIKSQQSMDEAIRRSTEVLVKLEARSETDRESFNAITRNLELISYSLTELAERVHADSVARNHSRAAQARQAQPSGRGVVALSGDGGDHP